MAEEVPETEALKKIQELEKEIDDLKKENKELRQTTGVEYIHNDTKNADTQFSPVTDDVECDNLKKTNKSLLLKLQDVKNNHDAEVAELNKKVKELEDGCSGDEDYSVNFESEEYHNPNESNKPKRNLKLNKESHTPKNKTVAFGRTTTIPKNGILNNGILNNGGKRRTRKNKNKRTKKARKPKPSKRTRKC